MNSNNTEKEVMAKNIVIGVGGTGLSTIRELRRLTAERYEEGLRDPAVAGVRYVYIDSDADFANRRTWQVLGKDISLQPGERVEISGDQLQSHVNHPRDYPAVADWLPAIANYVGEPGEGAKGIRPYGRLIYEYEVNKNKVRDAVIAARDSLNQALPHEAEWRLYIVCSLSGGTGSGMFLPLAQDLIDWKIFSKGVRSQKLRAFLVLPPLAISRRHDRYHANAFAALKELNYHGVNATLPFSGTYLIEPVNEAGHDIGLDNLPLLIAQRLFLNIQKGEANGIIEGLMDNPNLGELEGDDSRRRHALSFSTFGLSSISYPREMIARSVSLSWACGVVSNWLQEQTVPQNVNQVVRNDLARLRLSRLHVNGDGDAFGNQDFPPHETELPNQVDQKIAPLERKQLGPNGHKVREELENGFRGVGIEDFYQQRQKDVKRAAEHAIEQVRMSVSRQIRDSQRGVRFAKEYLEELRNILEKELKPDAAARFGQQAQGQVAVFQRNYAESVNSVSQHEQSLIYFNKEFARDKAVMEDELKAYLVRKAGYWSGKYATALLDLLIPMVAQLRAEIDVWFNKVTDVLGKLEGRLQATLQGRADNPKENGTVIFNVDMLKKVANEAPADVVNPAIERLLRIRLGEELGRQFDDLDLFLAGSQENADVLLESTAFEFILSKESPIDVRRVTLYDRFITDYQTQAARRTLLDQTKRLSEVFVRTLPEEVGRRPVHATMAKVVSIPNVTGRVTKENEEAQAVVRRDLEAIGVANGDVQATQDVERIVFISEKQAFPIRFIESVKELKKYYDRYSARDALHIDKREVPKMYELFLLSDQELLLLEEAEEAFLAGRASAWLVLDKNQLTLKPEVRYEYEIPGKIGRRAASFGPDWDAAFERFTQDSIAPSVTDPAVREARQYLTERAKLDLADSRTDPQKWDQIFQTMKAYLDATLAGYRARMDDPRYKRDQQIIERIIDKHDK
jgi:hypothetical protein